MVHMQHTNDKGESRDSVAQEGLDLPLACHRRSSRGSGPRPCTAGWPSMGWLLLPAAHAVPLPLLLLCRSPASNLRPSGSLLVISSVLNVPTAAEQVCQQWRQLRQQAAHHGGCGPA